MFKSKKKLKQIEIAKQQLEAEKKELLFIKEQLEDSTPKVDISDVYVWMDNGLCNIVKLDIQKIHGRYFSGLGSEVDGYQSTLIDIFSKNVVYQQKSIVIIQRKQYIAENWDEDGRYAYLLPLHEVDKNLLAYTNKLVPLYVLQQLYYKLNNIDVNAYILKKEEKVRT